jgi:hypothetical protein
MAYELNEGQGTLFRNDKKPEGSKQPDYRGELNVGGTVMEIAGWLKEGKNTKYMSLKVQPKQAREAAAPQRQAVDVDQDVPF